jgi:hypothetical protein
MTDRSAPPDTNGLASPGPQPLQPPDGPPPEPPKKRRAVVVAGIALAVAAAGVAIALSARARSFANSPDGVREAYMAAYENHDFGAVVGDACSTYKREFGMDTSTLEQNTRPFQITATAVGEPAFRGNAATANIDLDLSRAGTSERVPIFIRMEKEDGVWRFCGEGSRQE